MWILVIYSILYIDNPVISSITGYKTLENCNENAQAITEMMRQEVKGKWNEEGEMRVYFTCVYQEQ